MFSTKSNVPDLLSGLTAIGPDWLEEEQQYQVKPLSNNTVLDLSRVEDKSISDFSVALAGPPEAVLVNTENNKEETSNTGNQWSSDTVVDLGIAEDRIVSDLFTTLKDLPEAVLVNAENDKEETSNTGNRSRLTAIRSSRHHATKHKRPVDDQIFSNNSSLQQHQLQYDNKYSCTDDVSDQAETTAGPERDKKYHNVAHSDDRPFKCTLCTSSFKRSDHLHRHKRSHGNERPYKCDACDMAFKLSGILASHKKEVHGADKSQVCDICSKKFFRKYDLGRHKKIHMAEKEFECKICNTRYTLLKALNAHIKRMHPLL